jgi:hypothetical protein
MGTVIVKDSLSGMAKTVKKPMKKSKTAIFFGKTPNGVIKVLDRRAVNK